MDALNETARAEVTAPGFVNYALAERIVALLNELAELDRPAIAALIANRVPCNEQLANHPTVQCGAQHGGYYTGTLGILNGLCGIDSRGWGAIAAIFDKPTEKEFGSLLGFKVTHLGEEPQERPAQNKITPGKNPPAEW